VVRRDLARYYRLTRNYEIHGLGVDGADVVVHAVRGFDDVVYQYIRAAVDELLSSRDAVAGEPGAHGRFWRVTREDLNLTLHMGLGGGYSSSPTPSQILDTEIDCDCRGLCSPQLTRG
jgi:hypothetical protein